MMLCLLLGMLLPGLLLMTFGLFGVLMRRPVFLGLRLLLEGLLMLATLPFLVEVCYGFVAGVWEAERLAAGVLVGCIGLARVMRLIGIALSILSIPLFLLSYSFAGALSPLLMFLRVSGIKGLLSLGGMLFWDSGMLSVLMVHVVLSLLFILGVGFPQIFMVSFSGFMIPLNC